MAMPQRVQPSQDNSIFSGNFLPGGSPTVPATAIPTSPQRIAPSLFTPPTTDPNASAATADPAANPAVYLPADASAMPTGAGQDTGLPGGPGPQFPGLTPPTGATATPPPTTGNTFDPSVHEPLQNSDGTWMKWDGTKYVATGSTTMPTSAPNIPATGMTTDMPTILAQISQWASMPGADPSLAADPNYWAQQIIADGGLGQSNLQYWQDAGVGPNAFFNNPNREQGGGGSGTGSGQSVAAPFTGDSALDPEMAKALSQLIDLGGLSPSGSDMYATLKDLIAKGGVTPDITKQIVAARDAEAGAETSQMSDANAQLASEGLMAEPGIPQGAASSAITRTQEELAPTYANAVAGVESHAADLANTNLTTALSAATGLSSAAASNLVSTVNAGTNRESAIAGIGLQILAQNQQWQEFLKTNQLSQDQLQAMIDQNQWQDVLQLIQLFEQTANTSAGGNIG